MKLMDIIRRNDEVDLKKSWGIFVKGVKKAYHIEKAKEENKNG